ncbi:MarR family transcriptional regulator [Mumia sp. zg.B53]|uniref:MarR family winged helix-turn-helix transcriptional regulator n=1 Tax=Mumia sp. zg.B53 TaxID=2855449 RepID=UPI001C6E6F9C|nr:MarR family transcriptional regulator [Mumia sp. zg.B53]MBW9215277.1 MarR family transcriptional regulator [Mumia sp. zg.B53]
MLTVETAERMVGVLGTLNRALRSSSHRWELAVGMRGSDLTLLRRLQRHGEQRVSDLADAQCVTASVISRQITTLEQDGLVERRADPTDARVGLIRLSDLGRARLEQVTRRSVGVVQSALADWDDTETERVADLISQLAERLVHERERVLDRHLTTDTDAATAVAAFPDRTTDRNPTS